MRLKYNRNSKLEVVGFGIFQPNEIINIDNESKAKEYLKTGYFNEIKEIKIESKKKGVINNATRIKRTYRIKKRINLGN
jgi:Zn/Cd-binding protein ZinT